MMIENRRTHDRYQIDMSVNIISKSSRVSAVALEISKAGIRLKSREFIRPDTSVSVLFKGQIGSHFTGSVVWGSYVPDGTDASYHIGVKFNAIIFPDENIMEMPSEDEMGLKVIDEIKKLGGTVLKRD